MRGKWQGGIKGLLDKCVRESNGEIWLNEEMIRRIKGRSLVEDEGEADQEMKKWKWIEERKQEYQTRSF